MSADPGLYQLTSGQRLTELEGKKRRYESLVTTLEMFQHRRTVPGLLPFGPRAMIPGKLVHTNEVMVLLGESYFAEISSREAIEIARRRIEMIEQQIKELTALSFDLSKKRSVRFEEPEAPGPSTERKPRQVPSNPSERAKLLKTFAEELESARDNVKNESNENVIFLEEEYADNTSAEPIRVHGLKDEDADFPLSDESTSDESDEKFDLGKLDKEIEMLQELQKIEEAQVAEEEEQFGTGLKKGFLIPNKKSAARPAQKEQREPRSNVEPVMSFKSEVLTSNVPTLEAEQEKPRNILNIISETTVPVRAHDATNSGESSTSIPWQPPDKVQEPAEEKSRKSLFKQRMERRRS
mmetsp:Transcript_1168/g.3621  ORF Transcript_1168/g.3621 Transcript_1168/m.3621 type:complete len:353 (-) Transcript_1168:164-1222(-)|eukprot:CAMPEP_0198730802 /NCGR_PEP_ID=MMETSP1475-20131203/26379_1 /TAXON_ID= ORGANISM="Unidentified sp., Strain CCMP1999" /NCGR_SAMPLE_ID=MMETSP1475 /ASSEMBLY_ACC=CAM_ASM_001111 /LENGTH=352 /DNA_ID=CAMNT_0044493667 /DNA_START=44 /DNA_END=1102 /DNA_ORIENTATION=-